MWYILKKNELKIAEKMWNVANPCTPIVQEYVYWQYGAVKDIAN